MIPLPETDNAQPNCNMFFYVSHVHEQISYSGVKVLFCSNTVTTEVGFR